MFNLIDEPWVPVRDASGRERGVGLRELYRDAPQLQELAIDFPLELVATQRMLVAILQSAVGGPSSIGDKARWLAAHDALGPVILDYLERWRHRFELFDPERPFMQRRVDPAIGAVTVAALRPDRASGNNATLFDHRLDREPDGMEFGAAARALLTTLLVQPGGGVSRPFNRTDSPGTKQLHALVEGETLWASLVLNAPRIMDDDDARPSWERDEREDDRRLLKTGTTPSGWLDRASWRSRAVELVPEDGVARRCRLHQHLKIADGPPFDPYAPVRRAEGEEPVVMRASGSKAIWRDAEALLRGLRDDGTQPMVVSEALRVLDRVDGPLPSIRVVGQVVNQAKVADVRDARLPVSRALLDDEELLAYVGHLVDAAELGARAVRGAIHAVATSLGAKDGWGLAARWETRYWAGRAQPFARRLAAIATATSATESLREQVVLPWRREVIRAVRELYDAYAQQGAGGPRTAKAIAAGRSTLERLLSKVNPDKETIA